MFHRPAVLAVALLAAAAIAAPLQRAQADPLSFLPVSVQVGVGLQPSGTAHNAVSGASFHAGASVNLSNTSTLFVLPGTQGIDADYNYASGHGGHYSAYGLTYTNRISLLPKLAQSATDHVVPYVGFGIGAFENQVRRAGGQGDKNDLDPGGKLIAGVGLPRSAFFEVSYILSGTAAGVRTDSVNFAIGTHI